MNRGRPAAIQKIFQEIANKYDLDVNAIAGGTSRPPYPDARAEIAWKMKNELNKHLTLNEIGRYLRCHHTTVLDMIRRAERIRANFKPIAFKRPAPAAVNFDPNQPDYSGEWAI